MDLTSQSFVPIGRLLQRTFDAAVVIPTVLRPSLLRAVRSVYRQKLTGTIQILIGIDVVAGDLGVLATLQRECPPNCVLTVLHLGYSTSVRHGGLHPGGCGGALRTILSYAANSRFVAYLDDDNWWDENHLLSLLATIQGHDWAFSLRWYVDPETERKLCVDEWESVGPGAGVFAPSQGGFVDPNSLMIDKIACENLLRLWCIPLPQDTRAMSEDRTVFQGLRQRRARGTGQATTAYLIHASDPMHPLRQGWIRSRLTGGVRAAPEGLA